MKKSTIVFIILIACIAVVYIFKGPLIEDRIYKSYREKAITLSTDDFVIGGIPISEEEKEFEEKQIKELKDTPSDIEGLSQYEKIEQGMFAYENSDSDSDGLTDKEEIEVYGSDPLKCSTAGDLYSDGYKIENDMDVNKKYEYEGVTSISDENNVVTLHAKTPYDLGESQLSEKDTRGARIKTDGMTVSDCTETAKASVAGEKVLFNMHPCLSDTFYKAYIVSGYDGDTIDIDLEAVAQELKMEAKDLDIEAYAKQLDHKISVKKSKGERKVKIDRESSTEGSLFNSFIIYIVDNADKTIFEAKKDNSLDSASTSVDVQTETEYGTYNINHGMIVICTPLTVFFQTRPTIYCSEDATEEEKALLIEQATKVYQSAAYAPSNKKQPVCDETHLTYTTTENIKRRYTICEMLLGRKNNLGYEGQADKKDRLVFWMYENLGDFYYQAKEDKMIEEAKKAAEAKIAEEAKKAKEEEKKEQMRILEELNARFDLGDEYTFANFNSPYTDMGVCMGIALTTAEVYNNGRIMQLYGDRTIEIDSKDESGNDIIKQIPVSYNITDVKKYVTFYNRHLNDYADHKDYLNPNSIYDLHSHSNVGYKM